MRSEQDKRPKEAKLNVFELLAMYDVAMHRPIDAVCAPYMNGLQSAGLLVDADGTWQLGAGYEEMVEMGAKKRFHLRDEQIKTFDGFKEDIYIADYKVDEHFLDQLPFKDFITIRPENLKAAYVPKDAVTIMPELFEVFKDQNILFLPRYEEEKMMAEGYPNIWYPAGPLNGLDVCYYTKAMLTGAGTFAREAALLGVPAVSFFPRNEFLTVDVVLQEQGKEFKSRDAGEIREYVLAHASSDKRSLGDTSRSKKVLEKVLRIFDGILEECGNDLR